MSFDLDIQTLSVRLKDFANFFRSYYFADDARDNLIEISGWDSPAISASALLLITEGLLSDIRVADVVVDGNAKEILRKTNEGLARMFNHVNVEGNPFARTPSAVGSYITTIYFIRSLLLPQLKIEPLSEFSYPASLVTRADNARIVLDNIEAKNEGVSDTISKITLAYSNLKDLELSSKALDVARANNEKVTSDSMDMLKTVERMHEESVSLVEGLRKDCKDTKTLLDKYVVAESEETTRTLSEAFENRAGELKDSMFYWVGALLLSLIIGGAVGAYRLDSLVQAAGGVKDFGHLIIQMVVAILSLSAPLWFAWIATKQISQRFRLAEDYAFKATFAKSYEGYKSDASRLDTKFNSQFESELFGAALKRLDEAPMRFFEKDSHGSPWHEFFESKAAQILFKLAPNVQEKLIKVFQDMIVNVGASKEASDDKNAKK